MCFFFNFFVTIFVKLVSNVEGRASSEILNFENRTIITEDMTKNVPEGEIQAEDICLSWDLRTSAS